MTRIFTHLFFITTFYLNLMAQVTITAVICEPQIGEDENGKLFTSVINDINDRANVDLAVILGNLTSLGLYEEFTELETALYNLKVPFRIIGGPNDILLSESKGIEIIQFWPDCQNSFHSSTSDKLFIQTQQYQNSSISHIPVEKINEIDEENYKSKNIFVFNYNNFENEIDNYFQLSNLLERQSLIKISSSGGQTQKQSELDSEIVPVSMSSGKGWSYTLLKESNDTLTVIKISEKQKQPEVVKSVLLNEVSPTVVIDSTQIISYLNGTEFHQLTDNAFTTFTPILSSGDKLFTASSDGTIICQDDRGERFWEYKTYGSVFNSILGDRDLIVTLPYDGDIYTINVNNGNLFQVIGIGEFVTSDISFVDIEYNDTKTKGIIAGTAEGNIYCYELYSLEMVWSNTISSRSIISNLLIANDKIIVKDDAESYYCVNLSNGLLIWEWSSKSNGDRKLFKSESCNNKTSMFTSDSDDNIYSVDILLGTNNWIDKKVNCSGQLFWSNIRSLLLVHTTSNTILKIDPNKGKIISKVNLTNELQSSLPSAWFENEDNILIGFDNGIVGMINQSDEFQKVLFTGNASIVSITSSDKSNYVTNNIDGRVTVFTLSESTGD